MSLLEIETVYGELLFKLDDIRDGLAQPSARDTVEARGDDEQEEAQSIHRAVLLGESAYNEYRERARRLQRAGGQGSEEYRRVNSSARHAIDTFLSSLGDCGAGTPDVVPRGVVKSNSSPSLNDVFSSGDDSPPQKRVRRAESSGLHAHPALQHRAHDAADAAAAAAVLSDLDGLLAPTPAVDSGRFVSDLSIASACIRGRQVTRCVCIDIGARDGGRCLALLSRWADRHAARAFQQPRMFGLLVEYSPLAAGAAVQRAFDAGYICVYVVCPGMTRDTCSSDLIETAGRNNCNLRSSGRAIRGEICIYQGDIRANLHSIQDTLTDICRDAAAEAPQSETGGACVGLITCHASVHAILSKTLNENGLVRMLKSLWRPFTAWALHICEPCLPQRPAWLKGKTVHLSIPGWTASELASMAELLCASLGGLAASAGSISVVPVSEMDAVIRKPRSDHDTAARGVRGDMVPPTGAVSAISPVHQTTSQRVVGRLTTGLDGLHMHVSCGISASSEVLRVDAVLGMELLLRALFDVPLPHMLPVFKEHLAWCLRDDQLTIIDPASLSSQLLAACEPDNTARISMSHFCSPDVREMLMARQPVVFNEIGAHLLFSAEGGIEPFEPALVLIGCGGFEL